MLLGILYTAKTVVKTNTLAKQPNCAITLHYTVKPTIPKLVKRLNQGDVMGFREKHQQEPTDGNDITNPAFSSPCVLCGSELNHPQNSATFTPPALLKSPAWTKAEQAGNSKGQLPFTVTQ